MLLLNIISLMIMHYIEGRIGISIIRIARELLLLLNNNNNNNINNFITYVNTFFPQ